ncbi:MAG: sulfatase-like hydrolase/transferase, partial [Bryobacteraceae bacterium]
MTQPEASGSRGWRRAVGCAAYGTLFWASFAIVEFYLNTVTSIAAATPLALHASMWPNEALLLSWFCATGAVAGLLAGLIFQRCAAAHAAGISLGVAVAAAGFFAATPQPYPAISAAMIALLTAGSLWGRVRNLCRTCLGGWTLGLLYTAPLWSALEFYVGMARTKQSAVYLAAMAAVVVVIVAAWRIRFIRELLLDPSPVRGAAVAVALGAVGVVAVVVRTGVPPDLPAAWRPSAGAAGRPNVVLLIMDSTRADHLSIYGYERNTTPRLEELAAEATLFRSAYANSDNSLQSHASMFTGLYPTAHGAHGRPGNDVGLPLSSQVKTIASILAGHGYATLGIAANYFYLHPKFGLGQGFQVYNLMRIAPMFDELNTYMLRTLLRRLFARVLDTREMDRLQRPAAEINQEAFGLLDQARNRRALPFLLTINYMDVHWPYLPPPPFDRLFPGRSRHFTMGYQRSLDPEKQALSPGDRGHLFSQYDGSIASLDAEIGALIQKLKDLGYYD